MGILIKMAINEAQVKLKNKSFVAVFKVFNELSFRPAGRLYGNRR